MHPRGYTMTELVMAASLSLLACLGGATAVQAVGAAEAGARAERGVANLVRRLDAAAPRGCCAVLGAATGRAACGDPGGQRTAVVQTPEGATVTLACSVAVDAPMAGQPVVDVVARIPRGREVKHALLIRE